MDGLHQVQLPANETVRLKSLGRPLLSRFPPRSLYARDLGFGPLAASRGSQRSKGSPPRSRKASAEFQRRNFSGARGTRLTFASEGRAP